MESLLSLTLILSTTMFLSMNSCGTPPLPNVPATPNVSFEKDIQPITSTVCIKCHSQGRNDFSQYHNAFLNRYAIRQRVAVERSMPLGIYLDDKDRALFRDWVDQGAKR
jgi:hypothetical protein